MMNKLLDNLSSTLKEKLEKKEQKKEISPMLATLTHQYFSDEEWIYERKLDGERCLLYKKDEDITLLSRNVERQNKFYPEIVKALEQLPGDFILDSELVTFDGNITSFERLQHRMHVKNPNDERLKKYPVYAYVFDILYYEGFGLEQLPLRVRKRILKNAFHYQSPIRFMPHRNKEGECYFQKACDKGWEGIIAKDAQSEYVHSRSKKWLKFKCIHQQEFVIGGYTDPEGARLGFGALLIGYYENGKLQFAGRVGTGFDDDFLEMMHGKMKKRAKEDCPFDNYEDSTENVHWIKPELVGEVGFTEWTNHGKLRHPRFLGLRKDKDAKEVHREDKSNK